MSIETGNLLRKMRMISGYTQQDMAQKFDFNRSTISRIEKGDIKMSIDDFWEWVRITKSPQTQEMLLAFMLNAQVISDAVVNMPTIIGFILPFVA